METNYVILLDFCDGSLNIIHLTAEEVKASVMYEDFATFLSTLEKIWLPPQRLRVDDHRNAPNLPLRKR